MFQRLLAKLQRLWEKGLLIWRMVFLCRFSALVVVAFGLAFLLVDQVQDLLMALDTSDVWLGRQWLYLYVAVAVAAGSSWYWARVLLSFRFPLTPRLSGFRIAINRELPRWLGVLLFALVALALVRAAIRVDGGSFGKLLLGAGLVAAQGALFYLFVQQRRSWLKKLDRRLARPEGEGWLRRLLRAAIAIGDAPEDTQVRNWCDLGRNTRIALGLSLATSFVLLCVVLLFPVGPARHFGPAAVTLTAAANLVPVGSLLVYLSNRWRLPVLSLVIAWAVLASFVNDNHAIRALPAGTPGALAPDGRADVAGAYRLWRDRAGPVAVGTTQRPIIVATAGGGSRAAYWTALVLGRLQDADPAFGDRLFAISGVSGGSLGAAIFVGELTARASKDTDTAKDAFTVRGLDVAKADFLSPTLAGLLYPDLIQRFLPPPLLPDRAEYLERGWEAAWRSMADERHLDSRDLFAGPFSGLWPGSADDWGKKARLWPALFFNGTNVETGKRVITSNLTLGETFRDAYDALCILGTDLAVSTAINMSTRFPYVEPAGTLAYGTDARCATGAADTNGQKSRKGTTWGHIVDGGYFENFGAATAVEIVDAIVAAGRADGGSVKPIVIQISSDPDYKGLRKDGGMDPPKPRSLGREIYAPVRTFFNTRTGRGSLAAEVLRDRVNSLSEPDSFFHFRLCAITDRYSPALGWALSDAAQKAIDGMLVGDGDPDPTDPCLRENRDSLRKLIERLREG